MKSIEERLRKLESLVYRIFVSSEQTGTGSSQNIAHGLGVIPRYVWIAITETSGVFDITEGTHDATNVVVTINSGRKYKVIAIP